MRVLGKTLIRLFPIILLSELFAIAGHKLLLVNGGKKSLQLSIKTGSVQMEATE